MKSYHPSLPEVRSTLNSDQAAEDFVHFSLVLICGVFLILSLSLGISVGWLHHTVIYLLPLSL